MEGAGEISTLDVFTFFIFDVSNIAFLRKCGRNYKYLFFKRSPINDSKYDFNLILLWLRQLVLFN